MPAPLPFHQGKVIYTQRSGTLSEHLQFQNRSRWAKTCFLTSVKVILAYLSQAFYQLLFGNLPEKKQSFRKICSLIYICLFTIIALQFSTLSSIALAAVSLLWIFLEVPLQAAFVNFLDGQNFN